MDTIRVGEKTWGPAIDIDSDAAKAIEPGATVLVDDRYECSYMGPSVTNSYTGTVMHRAWSPILGAHVYSFFVRVEAAPKPIEQAMAEERAAQAEWEAREEFQGVTIAELRRVFDLYTDPADWKTPFEATVPLSDVSTLIKACTFFLAAPLYSGHTETIDGETYLNVSCPGYLA